MLWVSFGALTTTTCLYLYSPALPSSIAHHVTSSSPSSSDLERQYAYHDAYRKPGYLHVNQSDYKATRWIPYSREFFDAPPLDIAAYPVPEDFQLDFDAQYIEEQFLRSPNVPRSWMNEVAAESDRRIKLVLSDLPAKNQTELFSAERNGKDLGWLWGRRFLAIGDSVDRIMMNSFCEEVQGKWEEKWHDSSLCQVPSFNLTLVHFHVISMLNYKPPWFEPRDMPTPFEERWEELWADLRHDHVRGMNGRGPDLIFWQTGLWDQFKLFFDLSAHVHGPSTEDENVYQNSSDPQAIFRTNKRQAVWHEIRYMTTRLQKVFGLLRKEFGSDVTIMYRALTFHIGGMSNHDYILHEFDRLQRALAANTGHEVFEWGSIMNGYSLLYTDETHLGKGPATWLWGNMFLQYMAKAVGTRDE